MRQMTDHSIFAASISIMRASEAAITSNRVGAKFAPLAGAEKKLEIIDTTAFANSRASTNTPNKIYAKVGPRGRRRRFSFH